MEVFHTNDNYMCYSIKVLHWNIGKGIVNCWPSWSWVPDLSLTVFRWSHSLLHRIHDFNTVPISIRRQVEGHVLSSCSLCRWLYGRLQTAEDKSHGLPGTIQQTATDTRIISARQSNIPDYRTFLSMHLSIYIHFFCISTILCTAEIAILDKDI